MLLIWGYRTRILQLAMVTFLCGQCRNPSAHALRKRVTKFTLFFIPLFPISVKYFTQCTFCGCTNRITKEDAVRIQEQEAANQAPVQDAGQPQQQLAAGQPMPGQPMPPQMMPGQGAPGQPMAGQPMPGQQQLPPQSQPFPQQQPYPQQQNQFPQN